MRTRLWRCALSLLLAAPAAARAQAVTGSLEGRIASEQGEPLANAVVTVSGPFLQGTRSGTTDARGYFQLQAMPPGEYELRLAYIGYRPLVIQSCDVFVDKEGLVYANDYNGGLYILEYHG